MSTPNLRGFLTLALFLAAAALSAAAQSDPAPPDGGFSVTQDFDQLVVLDDGYNTMADAQYPSTTPPASGWPVIIIVHGLGGNRTGARVSGEGYAAAGYFVYAFDVRGQGDLRLDPVNAGKGTTLIGVQERRDVKTHVDGIAAAYAGIADVARLGMLGGSQGGAHSWAAAAWSGQVCDSTDPGFGVFPVFSAVSPASFSPYREAVTAPGGQAVRWRSALKYVVPSNTVILDPAFEALMGGLLAAEDFEQIHLLSTDPNVDASAHLAQTTVPVQASHAFQDYWLNGETLVDAFHALGSGQAKRMMLATGGHGTPRNVSQGDLLSARRRAWFDHHLKGRETGILVGNRFEYSIIPSDPAVHDDLLSRWDRRAAPDWPPAGPRMQRLYLRSNGELQKTEPGPGDPDLVITQTVTPGYGMAQAIADKLNPAQLLANVPEDMLVYESSPLTDAITVIGDPRSFLSLFMSGSEVQLTIRLLDVPPTGAPRYITGHHFARRFSVGQIPPTTLDVELPPVAWRFEAGHRIRVELSNQSLFNSSLDEQLWLVPYFTDFSVTIHHAQGSSSFIELPVIRDRMTDAKLYADRHDLSAAIGAAIACTFSTDTDYAGHDYHVLGSLAGMTPGIVVDGLPLWLNVDNLFTRLLANPDFGPFSGMAGVLDANGEAFPIVDLTAGLPSAYVGTELSLAGAVFDNGSVVATSNPVTVTVYP